MKTHHPSERILVWDWPTRVFHWALALSFLLAYVTGESDQWAKLHVVAGYSLVGLIGFRLIWGFAGTRYAQFSSFWPSIHSVSRYLAAVLKGKPQHFPGHNPLGALAILALLSLGLITGLSGWMIFEDIGGDWLEEVHESAAALMLGVIGMHIAGVMVSGRLHGEKLIPAMFHGMKQGRAEQAINKGRPIVAGLLLLVLISFWVGAFSDSGQILFGEATSSGGDNRVKAIPDDDND